MSDTKVYEPCIRALLGTCSYFCEVVILKSRTPPGGACTHGAPRVGIQHLLGVPRPPHSRRLPHTLTVNPEPSAKNRKPKTLNLNPKTWNDKPSPPQPQPTNPKSQTPIPKSQTPNPSSKPQTPNLKPQTLTLEPKTPNPQPQPLTPEPEHSRSTRGQTSRENRARMASKRGRRPAAGTPLSLEELSYFTFSRFILGDIRLWEGVASAISCLV